METREKSVKKCFQLTQQVFENLNISHFDSTCLTVLYNKHQIFIYCELKFEELNRELIPEFDIFKLVVFSNHIVCLDFSGNVHLIVLKFKQLTPKISCSFQPRLQNVIEIDSTVDYFYSFKSVTGKYFICQHSTSPEFHTKKEVELKIEAIITNKNNVIFYTQSLNELDFQKVKCFLKIEDTWNHHTLILISFDRLMVYAILYSNSVSAEPLIPVELYTCPTEICNLMILKSEYLSLILSLTIGTVIKIPFGTNEKELIIHLNSSVHQSICVNNYILYTDSVTLWKVENAYTDDLTFKKCFISNVKDFYCVKNLIICTTFNNLVYLFNNEEYFNSKTQQYISSDMVFSNSDCLKKITDETAKSAEIISKINKTKSYISTLALSARQDVMDDIIKYNLIIYECFENILKENIMLSLVDDIKKYYDMDSKYLLIKISTTSLLQKFSEILSNVLGDLRIHIIVKSRTYVLKTVTISVDGQMKKMNIVVPLKYNKSTNKIHVAVKLITKMSSVFDNKQPLWTVLHNKDIVLNSEHFIKTYKQNNYIVFLNNKRVTTEDLLYENATRLWSHLLQFNKISVKNTEIWCLFLKLPENYEQIFRKNTYLKQCLDLNKAEWIQKLITQEGFLKARNEVCFDIGDEVKIEIIKDGFSKPSLKISSFNLELAFNIKLFFANLLYFCGNQLPSGTEFVDQAVYSSTESLEQVVKKVMMSHSEEQEMRNIFKQCQKILSNLLI